MRFTVDSGRSGRLAHVNTVRLTQFTDLHLFGDGNGCLRGVPTLASFSAALEHARQGAWPPDALLLTGDLVHDDAGGYAHVRLLLGSSRQPVLCLPGNHDVPAVMRRELSRPPFVNGGHMDLGVWRIVLLDSVVPGQAGGTLSASSLVALDQALSSAAGRHVLICLHHHPVPVASDWLDQVGLSNAADLFAVIDRRPNVRGLVWGHVHQSFDALRNGVRLLATPSTCVQFLPRVEQFALDQRPPGYRTFELHPDGSMVTTVFWTSAAPQGSISAA